MLIIALLFTTLGFADDRVWTNEKSGEANTLDVSADLVQMMSFTEGSDYAPQDTSIVTFNCNTTTTRGDLNLIFPANVSVISCTSKIDDLAPEILRADDTTAGGDTINWAKQSSYWTSSSSYDYDIVVKIVDNRSDGATSMDVKWIFQSGTYSGTVTLNQVDNIDLKMSSLSGTYPFVSETITFPVTIENPGKKVTDYSVDIIISNETDTVFKSTETFSKVFYTGESRSVDLSETFSPKSEDVGKYTIKAVVSTSGDTENSNDEYTDDSYSVYDEFLNTTPAEAIDLGVVNSVDYTSVLRNDKYGWFKFTCEEDVSDVRFSICGAGKVNVYVYESLTDAQNGKRISGGYISSGSNYYCGRSLKGNGLIKGTYYAKIKLTQNVVGEGEVEIVGAPNDLYQITTKVLNSSGHQIDDYDLYIDGQTSYVSPVSGDDSLCYFNLTAGVHTYSISASYFVPLYDVSFTVDAAKQIVVKLDTIVSKTVHYVDTDSNSINEHEEGYYKLESYPSYYSFYQNSIWSKTYFPLQTSQIERSELPGYELVTTELDINEDDSDYYLVFKVEEDSPYLESAFVSIQESEKDSVYLEFDRMVEISDSTGLTVTVDGSNVKILSVEQADYNRILVVLESNITSGQTAKVSYSDGNIKGVEGISATSFSDITIQKDYDAPAISYNFDEGSTLKGDTVIRITFDESAFSTSYDRKKYMWEDVEYLYWYNYYISIVDTTNGADVGVVKTYSLEINDDYTEFAVTPLATLPDGDYMLIVGDYFYDEKGNQFGGDTIGFAIGDIEESAVTDLSAQNKIEVYPNPASDYLVVESSEKGLVYIYNSVGKLCKQIPVEQDNQQINVGDLSSGLYLLKINNVTQRILITE